MKNRFEEKRDKSTALIEEVALKLFSEDGYEKTSIRSIAKEANISLGLLYNYFPSKEALLLHLLQTCFQNAFIQNLTTEDNGQFNFKLYIRQVVKTVKQNRQAWKLYFSLRFKTSLSKEVELLIQKQMESILPLLEEYLAEEGIPFPGMEGKLLWASLNGIIEQYFLQSNYPLDDLANLLIMKYAGK